MIPTEESKTLEELAQEQGVHPLDDVRTLYNTWPGDVDDGFEDFIQELRRVSIAEVDNHRL